MAHIVYLSSLFKTRTVIEAGMVDGSRAAQEFARIIFDALD
jgi:hypothetical protein